MLNTERLFLALALGTAIAVGCGGGTSTNTGGSAGSGGQGGTTASTTSSTSSSSSSSSSSGEPVCMGETRVLAVNKLYFGEGNSGQWKKFGRDLDGLKSDGSSTDVCKPASGGKPGSVYPDGDDGIDNSFGKLILPQILSLYPTWTTDINNAIAQGLFTVLFKMECLPDTGDVPTMTTKLFGGTSIGMPPKFDGTDKWPVEPELLSDPMNPDSSTIVFANSSVTGNLYDSAKNQTFIITVPVTTENQSRSIKLTLYAAHLTMNLSADRKSATGGMIGGVLHTEEFIAEVKKVGHLLQICSSPLFSGLMDEIRKASDIMADGTQDPTKTCDGISMGLGFDMKEAQLGDIGPVNPVGMACP